MNHNCDGLTNLIDVGLKIVPFLHLLLNFRFECYYYYNELFIFHYEHVNDPSLQVKSLSTGCWWYRSCSQVLDAGGTGGVTWSWMLVVQVVQPVRDAGGAGGVAGPAARPPSGNDSLDKMP